MKTIERKYYVCEKCGKTSQDAAKIKACQDSHTTIDNTTLLDLTYSKGVQWPDTIKFTQPDGSTATYTLIKTTKGDDAK